MEYIIEAVIIAASSTGVFGAIVASLLSKALSRAKEDAETHRAERFRSELLRCEYEELSAELLLALARYQRGDVHERELMTAEQKFNEVMERLRDENRRQRLSHLD